MKKTFYSHGKLLITGEYAVLDGALSLALPTRFGQSMEVERIKERIIQWESRDIEDNTWFKTAIPLPLEAPENNVEEATSESYSTLLKLLKTAEQQQPEFFASETGFKVVCHLGFPRDWGLGSSSTLVNNIAQWTDTDPYLLLAESFGGSGYDIACARQHLPLLYQLTENKPNIETVEFDPSFSESLYFVHLNQKQNSREGIRIYRESTANKTTLVKELNQITHALIGATQLDEFASYLEKHEQLISKAIRLPMVKEKLFPDFPGSLKSLGAWGGDFVLATGGPDTPEYFRTKGYQTIVPYREMIL
ncbi:GYDIA family GHMP kinase [Zeaxanthinibacter sp. PT1]|uniref:GYDIA family GHMP kinase n=1 Tax=Zeaxanthinibacter TaxID=561554 RepID=UPI00234AB2F8|nr:GYDIA family GHMP kinase [Zeaxanthinibacter sp. PT1]MDC6351223.1 GYDIA family GHMP kinase [Zeaxanthinibacter sp. PT1]